MEDNSFFNNIWAKIGSIVASAAVTLLLGRLGCNQFATSVTSGAAGAAAEEVLKPSPPSNSYRSNEYAERNPIHQEERSSLPQSAPEYRPTTYACSVCSGVGQVKYTTPCTYCSGYGGFGCTYCFGTGKYYNAYNGMYYSCNGCGGSGILKCTGCYGAGVFNTTTPCAGCKGDGAVGN